ncbi:MAG: hypothetical protein ABW036_06030, partial [Flavitalea sp.]
MEKTHFEVTNDQRKYLGLTLIEEHWEPVKISESYYFFDGDVIRKEIKTTEDSYFENDLNEKTAENRTILLPKTSRGKPKKLNFTATQSFSPLGVYFSFSDRGVKIASYTTQTTYYSAQFEKKTTDYLKVWLDEWIAETTEQDLAEINTFRNAARKHCKFKEGDFFAFKIGRRNFGFGRILIDVFKRRNDLKKHKNYGLTHLMGKALIV